MDKEDKPKAPGGIGMVVVLKTSKAGILFPLMIAALVPIRMYISKFFNSQHVQTLLAEDLEEEEKMWEGTN